MADCIELECGPMPNVMAALPLLECRAVTLPIEEENARLGRKVHVPAQTAKHPAKFG